MDENSDWYLFELFGFFFKFFMFLEMGEGNVVFIILDINIRV